MKFTNEFYLPTIEDIGKIVYRSDGPYYNVIVDVTPQCLYVLVPPPHESFSVLKLSHGYCYNNSRWDRIE